MVQILSYCKRLGYCKGILVSWTVSTLIFLAKGKSSVRYNTILCGRPYGGLGILWNKSLSLCVKPLSVECDRVDGICVTLADGNVMLVLNVYLPVDPRLATYTTVEYEECIAVLDHKFANMPIRHGSELGVISIRIRGEIMRKLQH